MNRRNGFGLLLLFALLLAPARLPAPLVHVPGEGWYYEPYGATAGWQRTRAKEQLQVAEESFAAGDFSTAIRAANRVLRVWPLSDYAPRAQYLIGRSLEAQRKDEAAFKAYQKVIDKYPKSEEFNEVLHRQNEIAGRFLAGQWFKIWNLIPMYPSMADTAKLYEKIVASGPYSDIAPQAQLNLGEAREKEKNYAEAVAAYNTAADRYSHQPKVAAEAMYRAGLSWQKQADTAEYDQGAAAQAIAAYTDFMTVYPDDPRVPAAQAAIAKLKAEQVRGNFQIAKFYEKNRQWAGAIVYYNAVVQLDPNSPLAAEARQRIEVLKPRLQTPAPAQTPSAPSTP